MAREAADRCPEAVCLPVVSVGVSEEHRAFDGTLYVSPDVFRDYVRETLESAALWFDAAIAVNGHGGNVAALQELCARLSRDDVLHAVEWTWWRALDRDDMGHAGKLETSLVQHLAELCGEPVDGVEGWGRYVESSATAYDVDEWTGDGVVGAASEASQELGEEVFEASVGSLENLVTELSTG